jgi:hypothetical protein
MRPAKTHKIILDSSQHVLLASISPFSLSFLIYTLKYINSWPHGRKVKKKQ